MHRVRPNGTPYACSAHGLPHGLPPSWQPAAAVVKGSRIHSSCSHLGRVRPRADHEWIAHALAGGLDTSPTRQRGSVGPVRPTGMHPRPLRDAGPSLVHRTGRGRADRAGGPADGPSLARRAGMRRADGPSFVRPAGRVCVSSNRDALWILRTARQIAAVPPGRDPPALQTGRAAPLGPGRPPTVTPPGPGRRLRMASFVGGGRVAGPISGDATAGARAGRGEAGRQTPLGRSGRAILKVGGHDIVRVNPSASLTRRSAGVDLSPGRRAAKLRCVLRVLSRRGLRQLTFESRVPLTGFPEG